ncbi:hypothetical protein LCL95_16805 [Bacillus timonensis]|nr:hypothetical protein [Bacillus timonensis]
MKNDFSNKNSSKAFPSFQMSQQSKKQILNTLREKQTINHNFFYKKIMPLISSAVLLFLLFAIGYYGLTKLTDENRNNATDHQPYSLNIPTSFTVMELEENEEVWLEANQKIGGVRILSEEEKTKLIRQPGVYENREIKEFQYPTVQILHHVKQDNIIQTIHYLIQPIEDGDIYNIYIHLTGDVYADSRVEERKELIYTIAKSFKLTEKP